MKMKSCLAVLMAAFVLGGASYATDCACKKTNVEAYAHPSLFGAQTFEYSTDNGTYVKGGDIVKPKYSLAIRGKDNTMVKTWANGVLAFIKSQYSNTELFNPKMPTLRSEWAVVLSEGFNLKKNDACTKKYSDITNNYWATGWICSALDADVMIGYPENVFKPDQPITKAEVFATIAKIVAVEPNADEAALMFKGEKMQYIPDWAQNATAEVIATKLLETLPDADKIAESEYLTKEQVAYLIGAIRTDLAYYQKLAVDKNAPCAIKKYAPVAISIKMDDRLSAKHSNIGDVFTAKTTKDVEIAGTAFAAGSVVKGVVTDVKRPGINEAGYIRVKFEKISNGVTELDFPKNISEASAETIKNPFILSRILAFPLTGAGRVLGVVGRTGGSIADTCGNRLEETGDNLGNVFVETIAGHPGSGLKSLGYAVLSVGKGVYDLGKIAVSGVFGVVYEVADEIVYVILPSASNDSALNPNEELIIVF